jgi:hypothetical protein
MDVTAGIDPEAESPSVSTGELSRRALSWCSSGQLVAAFLSRRLGLDLLVSSSAE